MDVKNALRDWRIPLIFAVPVLLCAAVLYLALQPLAGSATTAGVGNVTLRDVSTPRPPFVPTPYPSVAPQPAYVAPAPCSTGVTAIKASAGMNGGMLVLRVVDQQGRPVVCAFFQPVTAQGQSFEFYGDTQGDGALRLDPPSTHFSIVEQVYFGSASTALAFSR